MCINVILMSGESAALAGSLFFTHLVELFLMSYRPVYEII